MQRTPSFAVFLQDAGPRMKSQYPFLSQKQIMLKLKQKWKQLDSLSRENYGKLKAKKTTGRKPRVVAVGTKVVCPSNSGKTSKKLTDYNYDFTDTDCFPTVSLPQRRLDKDRAAEKTLASSSKVGTLQNSVLPSEIEKDIKCSNKHVLHVDTGRDVRPTKSYPLRKRGKPAFNGGQIRRLRKKHVDTDSAFSRDVDAYRKCYPARSLKSTSEKTREEDEKTNWLNLIKGSSRDDDSKKRCHSVVEDSSRAPMRAESESVRPDVYQFEDDANEDNAVLVGGLDREAAKDTNPRDKSWESCKQSTNEGTKYSPLNEKDLSQIVKHPVQKEKLLCQTEKRLAQRRKSVSPKEKSVSQNEKTTCCIQTPSRRSLRISSQMSNNHVVKAPFQSPTTKHIRHTPKATVQSFSNHNDSTDDDCDSGGESQDSVALLSSHDYKHNDVTSNDSLLKTCRGEIPCRDNIGHSSAHAEVFERDKKFSSNSKADEKQDRDSNMSPGFEKKATRRQKPAVSDTKNNIQDHVSGEYLDDPCSNGCSDVQDDIPSSIELFDFNEEDNDDDAVLLYRPAEESETQTKEEGNDVSSKTVIICQDKEQPINQSLKENPSDVSNSEIKRSDKAYPQTPTRKSARILSQRTPYLQNTTTKRNLRKTPCLNLQPKNAQYNRSSQMSVQMNGVTELTPQVVNRSSRSSDTEAKQLSQSAKTEPRRRGRPPKTVQTQCDSEESATGLLTTSLQDVESADQKRSLRKRLCRSVDGRLVSPITASLIKVKKGLEELDARQVSEETPETFKTPQTPKKAHPTSETEIQTLKKNLPILEKSLPTLETSKRNPASSESAKNNAETLLTPNVPAQSLKTQQRKIESQWTGDPEDCAMSNETERADSQESDVSDDQAGEEILGGLFDDVPLTAGYTTCDTYRRLLTGGLNEDDANENFSEMFEEDGDIFL